jgi:hypothetical protein
VKEAVTSIIIPLTFSLGSGSTGICWALILKLKAQGDEKKRAEFDKGMW